MPQYELMFILSSAVPDNEEPALTDSITQFIAEVGGEILNVEKLGKRKLAYPIKRTRNGNHNAVEPTVEAEDRYTTWVHDAMERTVWKSGGCNSWYQNSSSGKVIAMYPGFSFSYRFRASRFRSEDHAFS